MDEDRVLMRRVATGDRQAFEMLYHRYAGPLAGYLTKLLRQREVVEEVLDDVMLVVWQNAARFDPTSRFSTWLFGIAHHKAMKARGRSANKPLPLPPLQDDADSDQENPERVLTEQERGRTFVQALESLSPEQRAVVELTFYHACSYQEIAEITGCPVNTVKTRMFHARRRLAQYLEALGLRHASERQEQST
jgi:RNA polymerase sigma-70 factor (ECF subfamily)